MVLFPAGYKQIGTYLNEQLIKYDTALYELDFSELWGLDSTLNWANSVGDLPLGLEEIRYFAKGTTGGMAVEYDGVSDDIPVIEIDMAMMGKFKAAMFTRAIAWDWLELERQKVAEQLNQVIPSLNTVSEKLRLLGEFFNRREHFTILYGLQEKGIYGLYTQKGIASSDTLFKPYAKTGQNWVMSPRELYNDFRSLVFKFRDRSRMTSVRGIDIKVPPLLNERLSEMYYDQANQETGKTIKQMLLDPTVGLGINSITDHNEQQGSELNKYVWNEGNTAMYPTNQDRIIFKVSNYKIDRHFYARKTFPTFQTSSTKYEQVAVSATTGLMLKDTSKMWYLDFSNAAV